MWVVVHMAKSLTAAQEAEDVLKAEGVLCKKRAVYRNKSDDKNYYEILVLGCEAEEARQVLIEQMPPW